MSADKEPYRIDVEIHYSPEDPSRIGFVLETADGGELTPQMIIDAISDVLIDQFQFIPELDGPEDRNLQ